MSQTILIEPNEKLRKVYSLNLAAFADTDVIDRENAEDAIALLKILPSIDLIICNAQVGEEDSALILYRFLSEHNIHTPLIVLGESKELAGKVLTLKQPVNSEFLAKHAAVILGVKEEELEAKAKPKLIPVKSYYFYEIDHTPCDVYIRIQKNDNSYQFVKRLHAQDSFSQEDIEKYEKQGLNHFYVESDFQRYFVNFVTNTIIQELEKDSLELAARLAINSSAYEIVREKIAEAGLDEATNELADSCIQSMVKSIETSPSLATLLKKLFSNKVSYAYQHSHLVCVIGNFILTKQKGYTKKHLDLFTMVAFFSDITLKSPSQIRVNSMDDLNSSKLNDGEKQAVLNHAKDAAEIFADYPSYSSALQEIITQHQGSMDGYGFPENPGEEIQPIAKIFIIADAFVKILLDPKLPKNKKEILVILYAQYANNSYQKIIGFLEQKID